jgi:hypothetical protein
MGLEVQPLPADRLAATPSERDRLFLTHVPARLLEEGYELDSEEYVRATVRRLQDIVSEEALRTWCLNRGFGLERNIN